MKAILYIAGRAVRLGQAARERPKVLLEFGGLTLLERHVRTLARFQVRELAIVTGYKRELLQAEFPRLESRYSIRIREFHNPHFTEGSALSMHCALAALNGAGGPVLLMDGDVLYDRRMIERLIRSPHPSALLVDRNYSTANDDPVLVPMRAGKPFDFSKKWQGEADAIGESVGFFKLHPAAFPQLIAEATRRAEGPGRQDSYDDILRVLVRDGLFGAEDVTGIPWTEIDFPEDLAYANEVVLPALKEEAT